MNEPQRLLFNAVIWTADDLHPWAEALLLEGNHILAVGSQERVRELASPEAEEVNLDGAFVMPGLWDAHIHFYHWSLGLRQVQLAGCRSLSELLERLAEVVEETPPFQWIRGWGWNETYWDSPELPTREALDLLTGPDRPCVLWRADMHTAAVNTAALLHANLMEEECEIPGGVIERDATGVPTGILRELAVNRVLDLLPTPAAADLDEALLRGASELHRVGITGICDQRMKDRDDGPRALAGLARCNRRGQLKLRVSCNIAAHNLALLEALGVTSNFGDERLRLGHIKIFCDGTLGSRTARMLQPFLGQSDQGIYLTPLEQIREEVGRALELGFPVSIHAIGDQAIRDCLDILEEAQASGKEAPALPHRIEHVQLLDDQDVERLVELGVVASMQPGHALDDMDTADQALGERARIAYRFSSLLARGTALAFGSDAPVSDHSPFYGWQGAVQRQRSERLADGPWQPQERIPLEATLLAYTLGAARAAGWDRLTGSLVRGKRGDLVVLDRNPFDMDPCQSLSQIQVLTTFFDGEVVYRA